MTIKKPVVNTRGVRVETREGNFSAILYPTDHPRGHLNNAPYVISSAVQEIRVITRNTEYVWKKNEENQEKVANAEDNIPQAFHEGALNP